MTALLLPDRVLSLTAEAADRLLAAANGDAALLYLGLLRHGDLQPARRALGWTDSRAAAALESLVRLSLAEGSVPAAAPEEEERPPVYRRDDLLSSLREDEVFRALSQETERVLGKPLSETDLQSLYTIYDYLALPAEVIFLLLGWCAAEQAHKYGPGRPPRMPAVKKAAFRWKRLGVDTLPAAEEFLARQELLAGRERTILPLLDIHGRVPVERERQYISGWVDMGFDDETIRLAYERTLFQKGSMNWAYMNSILKSWHAAGLHTVAAVEAGDRPAPRPGRKTTPQKTDYQPSGERIRKNADWLDEFLANQGKEG